MNNKAENSHVSVLLDESIELLQASRGGLFVDATLGLGGHTVGILEASDKTRVIAFDQDSEAIEKASERIGSMRGTG